MPAESESQRKAAGAALGAKRGDSVKSLRGASKGMYESMTEDELEDFSSKSLESSPSLEGEPSHTPSLPKATESLSTSDKSDSPIEKQPKPGGLWSGDKARPSGDAIQRNRRARIAAGGSPGPLPKSSAPPATLDKSYEDSLVKAIDFYLKEDSQSSIDGFTSKNFDICPNAVNVFRKLEGSVNSKAKDSIVFAAKATDDFLGIEKKVVSSKSASLDDIEDMVNLMQAAHFHAGEISRLIGEDLSTDFAFSTGHLITVMEHYESKK